jgi:MFS family permease
MSEPSPPNSPARLSQLANMNAYWFGLSFMWNSLHVIILPAMLLQYVVDARKNTMLGLLTFTGLIIALAVQPVSGAVSDRWRSAIGRRRPLIIAGTLLDLIFLALMATAGSFAMLALGYLGLQVTSNLAHGPAQGLMHDRVPASQMGRGSAIKNLMDMGGLVVASLAIGNLLSPNDPQARGVIGLVGLVLIMAALPTVLGVREASSLGQAASAGLAANVRRAFRLDLRANRSFWQLIAGRFVFLAGVYGIQTFAQYFVRDTLPSANPVKLTGDLLAAIVLALIAFSVLAGFLSDRIGRKPVHILAAGLVAGGSLLMLTARTPAAVLGVDCILGAGIGLFLTANWALANDLAPAGEGGKFLGLTNLATAGAGAASRLMGPLIDTLNAAAPGRYLGYAALFGAGALFAGLSLLAIRSIPDRLPLARAIETIM